MIFILLLRILLGVQTESLTGKPLLLGIMSVASLLWFTALMELDSHYGDKAALYLVVGTTMLGLLRWRRRHRAPIHSHNQTKG